MSGKKKITMATLRAEIARLEAENKTLRADLKASQTSAAQAAEKIGALMAKPKPPQVAAPARPVVRVVPESPSKIAMLEAQIALLKRELGAK